MTGRRRLVAACLMAGTLVALAGAGVATPGRPSVAAAMPRPQATAVPQGGVTATPDASATAGGSGPVETSLPGDSGDPIDSGGPIDSASPPLDTFGPSEPPESAPPSPTPSPMPTPTPTPIELMPVLKGTVLDLHGRPLDMSGGHIEVTEDFQGLQYATSPAVGADGRFTVRLMPWGTAEDPATVKLSFDPTDYTTVITWKDGDAICERWDGLTGSLVLRIALAGAVEPAPVVVAASREVSLRECIAGETGSPTSSRTGTGAPASTERATPPATSGVDSRDDAGGGAAWVAMLATLALAGAVALLVRRSRERE